MESSAARLVVESWQGGGGIVPRGPKSLLSVVPAMPADVERHTGRRPALGASGVWRLEVGGRFLASSGLVYPGGVPFPEELRRQTAVIASEVWLYADGDGEVLGSYWWPEAVRRPVASTPTDDFSHDQVVHPADVSSQVSFALALPTGLPLEAVAVAVLSPGEAVVFCTDGRMPDPLNELVALEMEGITIRQTAEGDMPDLQGFLHSHQPPYRRTSIGVGAGAPQGIGRDPGRSLGPQTWPWPAELRWCQDGISYEMKGFQPLATLSEVARSLSAG